MTEKLRLTIAPGQRITVGPHPSGFPGLPPLVLHAGEQFFAEEEEANRLYVAGKVLNLRTGKAYAPPKLQELSGARIRYGDGPWQDSASGMVSHPNWAALVEHDAPEPVPSDRPAHG